MERRTRASGFTLIELLIVVAIIGIIVSMSVFMIGALFKGSSVKSGGRVVQAAFARARQQASTKRLNHYLVFDFANGTMRLYSDDTQNTATARDRKFTSADPMAGEAMPLPFGVYFDRIAGETSGNPYAAFQADGSCAFYNSSGAMVPDVQWASEGDPNKPPPDADIVLRMGPSSADAPDKVFMDVVCPSGLLRKIEFYHLRY
jgi:prepilin-type N-terminal cleavage/methylation domain-containing protein